ncbi:alpha-1,4 glucan phosphorylase [Desulfosarcina widdelii]|uniref:Alpha-1,4 glucan phosphorylase n=1 Tax=Desulfosarcina widdelii TaxID=947919 RepID=A0A5K7ZQ68_9BACT|nr:glycogen/starch/alpha-glucan phosphorylase [Desulfosarcina widdelii]BBO79077.1 alpha-1,4 glucan phosphorylase [Desulfosarcina widdelii]
MKTDGQHDKPEECPLSADTLEEDIARHIRFTMGRDPAKPNRHAAFMGLAFAVRDRLMDRWIRTQRTQYDTLAKRVYFLSLEFLPGRFLMNYLISLKMVDEARRAVEAIGYDLEELEEEEWDAGLGNGGLGRLASCYMDSLACLDFPGYGYGIFYDYGIFHQIVQDGWQREQCDNWVRRGTPWEIRRGEYLIPVQFYGRTEAVTDAAGRTGYRWVGGEVVMAMACDILVPGYGDDFVTNMRLWRAQSSREFDLEEFNQGDYIGAVEAKVQSETISSVLYPSDEVEQGRELRLKQQYFFVAATLSDILRRYKKLDRDFSELPDFVAIQLNDTHPAIAIPELMRLLMDEEGLTWETAWPICEKTFAYTNHTVLPEALETWPVDLIGRLLPRHMDIIFEINRRFLSTLAPIGKTADALLPRVSLIAEGSQQRVRMAHLAIVGSHTVNGVAALHSKILKESLFKDFDTLFPGRLTNVTNGITPRRWLAQANPSLAQLIDDTIGPGWITDLKRLRELEPLADDADFRHRWISVKKKNKKRLSRYILRKIGLGVDPDTLFSVQVKRIHEYKRQLLNVLHVIALYHRIKADPAAPVVPRTVIFAGKAAPAYHQAKRIIKLINSVAAKTNNDPDVQGKLRVLFLPNYCVSQAEKIVPAVDLSEQISTAGLEASGTGNMKMSLNGALTIGTLDGANIEIMEEVGKENIFIFGLTARQVTDLRNNGYNPWSYYENDAELRRVLDSISRGDFSPTDPGLFAPVVESLLHKGDYYMLLADFRAYVKAQEAVGELFLDQQEWTRRSILNTARMGKFSSDRSVMEYAENIWGLKPLPKIE